MLRQRGREGLSPELSRTLIAAAEMLLSPQLTPREVSAVCRLAALRLYELPEAERQEICGHLALLERWAPLLTRSGTRFNALSPAGRRRCLAACADARWAPLAHGHHRLRHLILMAYMDCHEAWPAEVEPLEDVA